uniref:Uncharacterized protein n=1 Tax=Melopsittacus undulatus TaxID=13146 RepID=A0A8C6N9S8_MELUD
MGPPFTTISAPCLGGGLQAGPLPPSPALCGLSRADGLEVNLLVEWTTAEAQVEALTVPVLHSIDHLLWHAHSEGEVPAHLPHHDGGANVLCLDLYVLARHLLGDLQAVGSVFIPTVLGAIGKGSGQLVHLCLVHFLVHALLEALEDDGDLLGRKSNSLFFPGKPCFLFCLLQTCSSSFTSLHEGSNRGTSFHVLHEGAD